MKKIIILLALLVFVAGCTNSTKPVKNKVTEKKPIISENVNVNFLDIPKEIKRGEKEYIRVVVNANRNIEDVSLEIRFPFESSCNGRRNLGNMRKGERREISCYIKPQTNGSWEGEWKIAYRIPETSASLKIKVYDSSEGHGTSGRASKNFEGVKGIFAVSPSDALEGTSFRFSLKVDDPDLVRNEECWCSIEEAKIEMMPGFEINGLEEWRKTKCGENTCYKIENIENLDEVFYAKIFVTETREFEFKATLENVWKGKSGSVEINVV